MLDDEKSDIYCCPPTMMITKFQDKLRDKEMQRRMFWKNKEENAKYEKLMEYL